MTRGFLYIHFSMKTFLDEMQYQSVDQLWEKVLLSFDHEKIPFLTDVWITGPSEVEFVSGGETGKKCLRLFVDAQELSIFISYVCFCDGLRFDEEKTYASGRFSKGRYTALSGVLTGGAARLYLRIEAKGAVDLGMFCDPYGLLPVIAASLPHFSWVVIGASGAGKTTFLRGLLESHLPGKRQVIMEKFRELQPQVSHVLTLCQQNPGDGGELPLSDLFQLAVRLSPEVIVIGELRIEEFRIFCHSVLSGHGQVFSTTHARDHQTMVSRFKLMDERAFRLAKDKIASVKLEKKGARSQIVDVHIP